MKQFLSINDVTDLRALLEKAKQIKLNPNANRSLGKNKSIGLIFLNPSLRTYLVLNALP